MYPASKQTTAPTTILGASGTALITMQEARDALGKADDVTDDKRIAALIPVAYSEVERKLNASIITQTRKIHLETWPNVIYLDFPPVASVTHVKYYNTSNVQTTASATTLYQTDLNSYRPVISLREGQTWPQLYTRTDAIEVQYQSGAAVGSIIGEAHLKEAILQELWGLFFKDDTSVEVDRLIRPFKVLAL